jgi:hypothetical protein
MSGSAADGGVTGLAGGVAVTGGVAGLTGAGADGGTAGFAGAAGGVSVGVVSMDESASLVDAFLRAEGFGAGLVVEARVEVVFGLAGLAAAVSLSSASSSGAGFLLLGFLGVAGGSICFAPLWICLQS